MAYAEQSTNSCEASSNIIVRDTRHKGHFLIDDEFINNAARQCGIYAVGVYVALCRHADKNQESFPSVKTIAEKLGISTRQVFRALETLEKMNIITRKLTRAKKGFRNVYSLLDRSVWKYKNTMTNSHCVTTSRGKYDYQSYDDMTNSHKKDTHTKDTSLSPDQLLEREKLEKEIKNLFPRVITPIAADITTAKLFLFLYKISQSEIKVPEIRSPVAYMKKMAAEDIDALLKQKAEAERHRETEKAKRLQEREDYEKYKSGNSEEILKEMKLFNSLWRGNENPIFDREVKENGR